MKNCYKCGKNKSLKSFHKNRAKGDGHADLCKSCAIEYQKKYRKNNLTTAQRKRAEIIELLGGICQWPGCEWDDDRALQIDHISNNGAEERRQYSTSPLYQRVLDNPEEYQLLCANHNWIKRLQAL